MKKLLAMGIILLLVCVSIPSSGRLLDKSNPLSVEGNTLYVGGDGPGNYSKIQDAIDNASDRDTVFVYNGTYVECLIVNKSINLIGEDRNTTIIDGNYSGYPISIREKYVVIEGFKIIHSYSDGIDIWWPWDDPVGCSITDNIITSNEYSGIYLEGSYHNITKNIISNNHGAMNIHGISNNISHNNISNNHYGIAIGENSRNNIISYNNIISNNGYGMYFYSNNNTINNNFISKNEDGIQLEGSGNTFKANQITSNKEMGIRILIYSRNNKIVENNITANYEFGIHLDHYCYYNIIYHNNLIINGISAYENEKSDNIWDDGKYGNYWDDYEKKYPDAKKKWWKGIWDTPYEIGDNKDNFPLINQYPKSVIKSKSRDKPFIFNFPLLNWLFERFPGAFPIIKFLQRLN